MLPYLVILTSLMVSPSETDDIKAVQGSWKIVTVLENGRSLTEHELATQFVANGIFTIDGLVISFLPPGQFEPRKIPFVLNSKVEPKAIDLMGTSKVGAQGIYMLSGENLMLTFPGIADQTRPTDFGNTAGSHRLLLVLQRVKAGAPAATTSAKPATGQPATSATVKSGWQPVPGTASTTSNGIVIPPIPAQLPAAPTVAEQMRARLIGTWGHQTEDALFYYTLNENGSFSMTNDWKSGFKNTFKKDQRSSGTWSLNDGVIVVTISTSTDSHLKGQVFSWRVTNLGDRDLIAVDNQGRLRHEWKVR